MKLINEINPTYKNRILTAWNTSTTFANILYLVCRNVGWNCLDGNGSSSFPEVHKTSTYIIYGA